MAALKLDGTWERRDGRLIHVRSNLTSNDYLHFWAVCIFVDPPFEAVTFLIT